MCVYVLCLSVCYHCSHAALQAHIMYLHGFTKLNSATNGDPMATEVNVGLESHGNYVLTLAQKPATTEMTQIGDLVVVECNGH